MINYPSSIDSFQNPLPGDDTNLVPHNLQHDNANDAIEALEAKVGVNSSAVVTSIDYKLTNHTHLLTAGATDVTATTAELNKLAGLATSKTELGYSTGVTSAIQTQLNAKQVTLTNSAGLLAALSDETGTGLAVFNNAPTITKPVINGTNPTGATYTPATGAQTVALDCAANNMHIVTGHANGTDITFTVANATNNQPFIVSILQGASVVSTIAGWFATVRWAGGSAPTLTATLNKRDTFGFIRTGSNTYDGFVIGQNC